MLSNSTEESCPVGDAIKLSVTAEAGAGKVTVTYVQVAGRVFCCQMVTSFTLILSGGDIDITGVPQQSR